LLVSFDFDSLASFERARRKNEAHICDLRRFLDGVNGLMPWFLGAVVGSIRAGGVRRRREKVYITMRYVNPRGRRKVLKGIRTGEVPIMPALSERAVLAKIKMRN